MSFDNTKDKKQRELYWLIDEIEEAKNKIVRLHNSIEYRPQIGDDKMLQDNYDNFRGLLFEYYNLTKDEI